jgi:hypothetical protein
MMAFFYQDPDSSKSLLHMATFFARDHNHSIQEMAHNLRQLHYNKS